jgi:hypothetical protein
MRLWLDDLREPWKFGFIGAEWVRNYDEAISRLSKGDVTFASLDHDIGACPECTKNNLHIGDMKTPDTTFFNTCSHAKNGYDVVCWMKENNIWPPDGVVVHSQNPAGKKRMQMVIDLHYRPWLVR